MSSNFNHSNLGDQFKKAVSDGLSSGDFRELNILINDTVSDVISQAGEQANFAVKNAGDTISYTSKAYQNSKEYESKQKKRNEKLNSSSYQTINRSAKTTITPAKTNLPSTKNVGQVSSVLYTVFGGIGTGITSAVLLAALICALIGFIWPTPFLCILLLLWGGSIFMIRKGLKEKDRLKRMKRYIALCAGKMYVNISDLAQSIGKSSKYVLKDVKKMLELGFFPEGHLDSKETCLMLDDATYREYLQVEKERSVYEQETKAAEKQKKDKAQNAAANPELQAMISEGQDYILKLRELNDLIPGEVISQKMYRMENLLKEIFERLEEDPAQMPQMHKLMNYYLPTTIKLLQSYADFDSISSPGTEVIKAKAEIEKTVDTINEAFTELLNKLFQSAVFDATTDAQVLQTMLAKEGLTKNDFKKRC